MRSHAADIDDLLVAPFEHQWQKSAGHQVGASQIHVPGLPPIFRITIDDWAWGAKYASIMNENIEAPKLLFNICCCTLDALLNRHVELDLQYLWRVLLCCHSSIPDIFFECSLIGAGTYGNAGSARFGKREGNGSANPLRGTADEDVLTTEVGFATVDCLIRITVHLLCVVISYNKVRPA